MIYYAIIFRLSILCVVFINCYIKEDDIFYYSDKKYKQRRKVGEKQRKEYTKEVLLAYRRTSQKIEYHKIFEYFWSLISNNEP